MAVRKEYLQFLLEWLAPLGEVTSRAMFGGHLVYCDGVAFALVDDNTLYLKADDATRARFERLGLAPFCPNPAKPAAVMPYYPPPAEFFEDAAVMEEWGRAAVETGRRKQANKKKKR